MYAEASLTLLQSCLRKYHNSGQDSKCGGVKICYEQALLPSNAQASTLCLGLQANEASATPSQLHRLKRQRQTAEGDSETAADASVPQQADEEGGAVGKSSEEGKSLSIQGKESSGPASLLVVMPQTLPAGSLAGQYANTVSSYVCFPSCEHPSSSCLLHLLYRLAISRSSLYCLCSSSTLKHCVELPSCFDFCLLKLGFWRLSSCVMNQEVTLVHTRSPWVSVSPASGCRRRQTGRVTPAGRRVPGPPELWMQHHQARTLRHHR